MTPRKLNVKLVLLVVASISAMTLASALTTVSKNQMMAQLRSLDSCVLGSVFSFVEPKSYPPTTIGELQTTCKSQSEAFKCVKERSKGSSALIKRGLAALISTRQRHHKKICTNLNSEASNNFVNAMKCIKDKKFSAYKQVDLDYTNYLTSIKNQNYNDSAVELNHFCCASFNWRKNMIDTMSPECTSSRQIMEEMMNSVISNEIGLICEDEDKMMSKTCNKLEPIKSPKGLKHSSGESPATVSLYLIATLGESD